MKSDRSPLITILVSIAIGGSLLVVFLYWRQFGGGEFSSESKDWAEFGEYLGGTIGPLVALVTVIAIYETFSLQRQQFYYSSVQSFEQTLFSLLGIYRSLLSSVQGSPEPTIARLEQLPSSGAIALQYWYQDNFEPYRIWRELQSHLVGERPRHNDTIGFETLENKWAYLSECFDGYSEENKNIVLKLSLSIWESIYKQNEYQLDSLFRTLYRLIQWIDRQPNKRLSVNERYFYVALIRAQLSKTELQYLFFNGLTKRGGKFKKYVERYALFDNLPIEKDPLLNLLKAQSVYASSAYDSNIAKKALGIKEDAEGGLA